MENIEPLISIPNEWFYPRILAAMIACGTLFKVVHPLFVIILFSWAILFVFLSLDASVRAPRRSSRLRFAVAQPEYNATSFAGR